MANPAILVPTRMAHQDFTTRSADETIALGRSFVKFLSPPKLVLLRGDLGAGKKARQRAEAAHPHPAKHEPSKREQIQRDRPIDANGQ